MICACVRCLNVSAVVLLIGYVAVLLGLVLTYSCKLSPVIFAYITVSSFLTSLLWLVNKTRAFYVRVTAVKYAVHRADYVWLSSPLPSARQHPSYGDCLEVKILSEQLCAELCDTMFAVRSTLMWAVLTGPTDWVSHIGTLTLLYYCNMVELVLVGFKSILTTNWFPSVLWHCWFGHLACKNRPRNDLLCVEWDIKPYTLTHTHFKFKFTYVVAYLGTSASVTGVTNKLDEWVIEWVCNYSPWASSTMEGANKMKFGTRHCNNVTHVQLLLHIGVSCH